MLAFLQFQFWTCNPFWVAAFLGSWLGLHLSPRVWNINSSIFLVGLLIDFLFQRFFFKGMSFTGMQHLFPWCLGGFIVDSPFSTFLERLAAPFGGCAIYSCIFGFWLGLQVFPWQYSTYSRGVFAAVPTGLAPSTVLFQCFGGFIVGACISAISVLDLQSLLGCCIPWVLVGPAFVPTGMEHQFLHFFGGFVDRFPISAFFF